MRRSKWGGRYGRCPGQPGAGVERYRSFRILSCQLLLVEILGSVLYTTRWVYKIIAVIYGRSIGRSYNTRFDIFPHLVYAEAWRRRGRTRNGLLDSQRPNATSVQLVATQASRNQARPATMTLSCAALHLDVSYIGPPGSPDTGPECSKHSGPCLYQAARFARYTQPAPPLIRTAHRAGFCVRPMNSKTRCVASKADCETQTHRCTLFHAST